MPLNRLKTRFRNVIRPRVKWVPAPKAGTSLRRKFGASPDADSVLLPETRSLVDYIVLRQEEVYWSRNQHGNEHLVRIEYFLLKNGDPNVIINVYAVKGQMFRECVLMLDNLGERLGRQNSSDWGDVTREQLIHRCNPLIDSIINEDIVLSGLLFQNGARVSSVVEYVHQHLTTNEIDPQFCAMIRELEEKTVSGLKEDTSSIRRVLAAWHELFLSRVDYLYDQQLLTDENVSSLRSSMDHVMVSPQVVDTVRRDLSRLSLLFPDIPGVLGAVLLGDLGLFRKAFPKKRNVLASDNRGITALHLAAGHSTSEFCSYLIGLGANPNVTDDLGMTPLYEAVYFGNYDAVQCLLKAGAQLTCPEKSKKPNPTRPTEMIPVFLDGYWRKSRAKALKMFVSMKWSLLHVAIWRGSESVLRLLLQQRHFSIGDQPAGETALDLAIALSRDKLAFILLRHDKEMVFSAGTIPASELLDRAIQADRLDDADLLKRRGVTPLPQGRFASFQRMNYEKHEQFGAERLLLLERGPSPILEGVQLGALDWTFLCRMPRVVCTHVQETTRPLVMCTGTDRHLCSFCAFLLHHKRLMPKQSLPLGPTLALGLWLDEEAQGHNLAIRIAHLQRHYAIKHLSCKHNTLVIYIHTLNCIAIWAGVLQNLNTLDDSDSGSPAANTMARHWLRTCRAQHKLCHSKDTSYAPTRLVEVSDGHTLRLVEHLCPAQPYITLSHRWSDDEESRTKRSNLEARLQYLPPSELTLTMRDAVETVRRLGYRYLWVDALCIVQDSNEDWIHEASQMSQVYKNSVLTIAVSCHTKPDTGMFRPRELKAMRPFPFEQVENFVKQPLRHLLTDDNDGCVNRYIFPSTGGSHGGSRPKSVLDTRGWILQEQLLSPRMLYYEQDQLYWDCVTHAASETSPVSTSLLEDKNPDETWAFRVLRQAIAGSGDVSLCQRHIAEIWVHVIQNYSARSLTHSNDKLVALKGIIQAIERLLEIQCIAGVWQFELWRQLIWWKAPTPPNTTSAVGDGHQSFGPSWSWLSVNGPVSYYKHLRWPDEQKLYIDLEPLLTEATVAASDSDSTTAAQGTLKLTGPSFSYCITPHDIPDAGRPVMSSGGLSLGYVTWIFDKEIETPLDIECVIIGEDNVAKELVCLCLIPDEESLLKYNRIGLCQWNGLTWQIAKYLGKEVEDLETKTFFIV